MVLNGTVSQGVNGDDFTVISGGDPARSDQHIDRQILTILLAGLPLKPNQMKNIANLDHSRPPSWRLMNAAEKIEDDG